MKSVILSLAFGFISISSFAIDEMQELYSRVYTEFYNTSTGNLSYLASQQAAGNWTDINYADKSINNWDPLKHLQRMRAMAKSYCEQTDKTSSRAVGLLAGVENGFTYWFTGNYTSSNWFYNDIAQQLEIGPIVALMKNYLKPETITTACNYLVVKQVVPGQNHTGTNLVWMSGGLLIRGAVQSNRTYLVQGVANIHSTIIPANKGVEGIQADNAFLFHGLQLYNGGYGSWLVSDVSIWLNLLRGLSFGFSATDVQTIRNILLQGNQWMVRRGQFDFGATGRDISRKNGTGSTQEFKALDRMKLTDTEYTVDYQNFKDHINGAKNDVLTGNKMFFRADYMVQKRSTYHLSIKMCSARTSGTEYMNGENAKGFWLPFGTTCLMKDAAEYSSIFPLWNWTRVPGTTATEETPTFGSTLNQPSTFVGGVSNGQCGVATLDVNKQSLTAKKSWFMFNNETVCLGAGITSTNANAVNTSYAQNILRGTVNIDGTTVPAGDAVAYNNAKWVFNNNSCYFFPETANVKLTNTAKTGKWSDINTDQSTTPFTESIFNIWTSHGVKPINASYSYIIVPDIAVANVKSYSDNLPVRILKNTSTLQAVTHDNQKLTGAVFYTAGELVVDAGLTITVDQPCALLIDQSVEPIVVTVSDPSQIKTAVNLTLKFPRYPNEILNFALPTGNLSGSYIAKTAKTFRLENYQGITFTKSPYLPLSIGESFTVEKVAHCSTCTTTTVGWSSSNTNVAIVNANGVISAVGNGDAIITATLNETGQTANCTIQVMKKIVNENFASNNAVTFVAGGTWGNNSGILKLSVPVGATVPSPEKNIALHNQLIEGDFVLAANVMTEETASTWNDLCVIWGHQYPANSYYYAHLCEGNDYAGSGIFKIDNGIKSAQLTDITQSFSANVWHEVALKVTGNEVKVFVDGSLVSATTCNPFPKGFVGFGSYNDVCSFDNLRVWQADKNTAINHVLNEDIQAFANEKNIYVQIPENLVGAKISVVDILGKVIYSSKLYNINTELKLQNLHSSLVILLIESDAGVQYKKLMLK